MPEFLSSKPVWLVFGILFLGAFGRGQAIYWLARVVTEQAIARTHPTDGWRLRVHRWLQGQGVGNGKRLVQRWGLPAITLCYLTVGIQSLVLAAAGVLRVRWLAFTLAQIVGSVLWATIYTTIGWAVWQAAFSTATRSPLGIAVGLVALLAVITLLMLRRGRANKRRPPQLPECVAIPAPSTPRAEQNVTS